MLRPVAHLVTARRAAPRAPSLGHIPGAELVPLATVGVAEPPPSHPMMAFLLTIGLPREREDEFYRTVVNDFLQRSWMTLPRLLKQIGCNTPMDVAAGANSTCPA